jgi:putative membrane protein
MSLFVYRSKKFTRLYGMVFFVYTVWFAVGLFVLGLGLETPMGPWADFIFIALAALVLFLHLSASSNFGSTLLIFLVFAVISGVVEAVGALTGFPFGNYGYTDQFGPLLFGILPAAIPLAWWVIVWPLHCLVHSACAGRHSVMLIPVLTALGAVTADLIIEPAATLVQGYWTWEGPGVYYGVPWVNFLGWFGTAFILSFLAQTILPHSPFKREELRMPLWVLVSTVFTFVVVSVAHGKWGVIVVAVLFFFGVWRLFKSARSNSLSQ